MNIFMRAQMIRVFSFIVALISLVAIFALIIASAYVRWNLNKDFSFFDGNAFAALIVSTFGLWIALLLTSKKGE